MATAISKGNTGRVRHNDRCRIEKQQKKWRGFQEAVWHLCSESNQYHMSIKQFLLCNIKSHHIAILKSLKILIPGIF